MTLLDGTGAALDGTGAAPPATRVSPVRVAAAMLARDIHVVLRKQLVMILTRVLAQPLLLLFTFSFVLPSTHTAIAGAGFGTVIVPGIVASTAIYAGIMGVTIPLISQMTFPREIDDRLVMPIPVWGIALQKVLSGALQSLFASVIIFPVLIFLHAPGRAPALSVPSWPLLILVFLLSSILSAALGLLLGTLLDPTQMNLLFTVIMTPALMLGCMYFPWVSLSSVRWLQVALLVNPVVYLSEAFRATLTPSVPHMPVWGFLTALSLGSCISLLLAVRTFQRRVSR